MLAYLALLAATAVPGCSPEANQPGGEAVASRFYSAPPARVHEAVADAMQAAGVMLFIDTEQRVSGERTSERIKALGVVPGDEAVEAVIEPATEEGVAGANVRVETRRRGNKRGTPERTWSVAVLDGASCLLELLSLTDPRRLPPVSPSNAEPVSLPAGTPVAIRIRRFLFSTDLRPNRIVVFEVANAVLVNGAVIVPKGAFAAAMFEGTSETKEFGRAAQGTLKLKHIQLADGTRIPLKGVAQMKGRSGNTAALATLAVTVSVAFASVSGTGFAIPAGFEFEAEVDGDQLIRPLATVPKIVE